MNKNQYCNTNCNGGCECSSGQKICPPGPVGARGATGPDGLSAYEVAVAEGFVGTEQEWLASLQGAPGVDGIDGTNGTNGLSAYEIAVADGFVGTEQEWLASLEGPVGPIGPIGPIGPAGNGAIIPYASSLPVTLTSLVGNVAGIPAFIGFGGSAPGLTALGANIDLTGAVGTALNFAFSVPRTGSITAISAYYSVITGAGTPTTIRAALYMSTTPNNNFTLVPGSTVTLAPVIPIVATPGTALQGDITLNYPVNANTRLLLVFYATSAVVGTSVGYASAGVAIS